MNEEAYTVSSMLYVCPPRHPLGLGLSHDITGVAWSTAVVVQGSANDGEGFTGVILAHPGRQCAGLHLKEGGQKALHTGTLLQPSLHLPCLFVGFVFHPVVAQQNHKPSCRGRSSFLLSKRRCSRVG